MNAIKIYSRTGVIFYEQEFQWSIARVFKGQPHDADRFCARNRSKAKSDKRMAAGKKQPELSNASKNVVCVWYFRRLFFRTERKLLKNPSFDHKIFHITGIMRHFRMYPQWFIWRILRQIIGLAAKTGWKSENFSKKIVYFA